MEATKEKEDSEIDISCTNQKNTLTHNKLNICKTPRNAQVLPHIATAMADNAVTVQKSKTKRHFSHSPSPSISLSPALALTGRFMHASVCMELTLVRGRVEPTKNQFDLNETPYVVL